MDGGYLIQGKWRFASNIDNSQWAMLGVQLPKESDAAPGAGSLLAPRSGWSIEDDWYVAAAAIQSLFSCVGGSSLALGQPIQRMWRDGNAIAQHITLNWDAVSTMVGQHTLGLDPKGAY